MLCVAVCALAFIARAVNQPPCTPPSIYSQPAIQNVILGSNAVFKVTATGSAPFSYQWSFNNTTLNNVGNISGATNRILTISSVTANNAGNYAVVINNACGSITSSVVPLNIMSWTVDSDYDGVSDAQEVVDGTDPFNPNSVLPVRLGYWSFDNTNTWVGDAGQLPLATNNLVGIPSWSTNAVLIDSANPAFLTYRDVETSGDANINCRSGSVRFWFKPDWSSADGGGLGPQSEARLIELGTQGSANGWWGLVIGSAGTSLYFGTQTNSTSTLTTNLTAIVSWTSNVWHQIVLTYSPTNSSLYFDGQPVVTNGLAVACYPGPAARALGFSIGSSASGANQARGAIDELETFNYPLDPAGIAANYQTMYQMDSDGDGLPNILENELGLDPYNYNSANGLTAGNGLLVFTPLK